MQMFLSRADSYRLELIAELTQVAPALHLPLFIEVSQHITTHLCYNHTTTERFSISVATNRCSMLQNKGSGRWLSTSSPCAWPLLTVCSGENTTTHSEWAKYVVKIHCLLHGEALGKGRPEALITFTTIFSLHARNNLLPERILLTTDIFPNSHSCSAHKQGRRALEVLPAQSHASLPPPTPIPPSCTAPYLQPLPPC